MMKRREFITLLGSAAAWPLAARAQQPALPVVGFLHSLTHEAVVERVAAFLEGLKEAGYSNGRNATIEFRWGQGDYAPHCFLTPLKFSEQESYHSDRFEVGFGLDYPADLSACPTRTTHVLSTHEPIFVDFLKENW
jgi:hypothetical protein